MTKAITANRLVDGLVVFWTQDGSWTERLSEALVADEETLAPLLAKAEAQDTVVVGAYLIDVASGGPGVQASRNREDIRAKGPTIRVDLGKQAEGLL